MKGTAGDRIYREREVCAVTMSGNVEGTVTAQHNSSDKLRVCCFVTAVKGTAWDRIYRRRERERGGFINDGGIVEGTVTAQHNSSDTVCAALLLL